MAVNLSPIGGVAGQFFDNNGVILSGGKIYTYSAGTSTNAITYTSSSGATPHTNPIILDSAGRVPSGEIWLADGISYKFVVKTAQDVLIGTYDNISGINSNFVAYTSEQEIQTATAGQTVFTLTTMQYQPGTNSLSVFVDGVNQYDGVSYSYVETDSTTITFTDGLHVGASVKFTTTQQQGAGVTSASQVSYDDTFSGSATNVQNAIQESLRGNTDKKHFAIGAVPRCTAGVFSLIDDAGHAPLNITSVTQPNTYAIRINYAETATKINTFVVGADDALAPYGLVCGGDVGTSYANILAFAPLNCFVDGNSSAPNVVTTPLWTGSITASKTSTSTVRLTHPPALNNDSPVVSLVNNTLQRIPVVSFGSTIVNITMFGDAEGFISYNGSAWSQTLSDNLTAPTIQWNAVSNALRITHTITDPVGLSKRVPMVTGHGGVYIPQISNIADDWFEVAFFDFAGTKITTPDTSMKIWYRRDFMVPCVWNDSTIVTMRRGLCSIPSANFSNVSGNNLWVTGTMEY